MSGHGRTRLSAQAHRRLSENFTPGRPESLQRCLFLAETRPVSCGIYTQLMPVFRRLDYPVRAKFSVNNDRSSW